MQELAFRTLLYRYFFFDWLFKDASRGDLVARTAAWRFNQSHAHWLLTYMRRWLWCGVLLAGLGGVAEMLMRAPVLPNGSVGAAAPVFPDDSGPSVQWFDLSHDGRLLAFTSTDPVTSQYNISVATYPDLRERRQVTSEGGTQPRFSRNGRELFYASGIRTPDRIMRGQLNVVSIETAPSFAKATEGRSLTIGTPTTLLKEGDTGSGSDRPLTLIGFDVGPDGRMLMTRVVPAAPGDEARVVIVQNWPASMAIRK